MKLVTIIKINPLRNNVHITGNQYYYSFCGRESLFSRPKITLQVHTFFLGTHKDVYITIYITYIHNWPLQAFFHDYDIASHTTHVVCGSLHKLVERCQIAWSWWPVDITIHTYIIDNYNHSVSHIVCVNFIHQWQDLQFKVDSERQIFKKLFMPIFFTLRVFPRTYSLKSTLNERFLKSFSWQFFLLSEFLPEICWDEETKPPKKYFFIFRFDVWPGIWTESFRLISQHTTY